LIILHSLEKQRASIYLAKLIPFGGKEVKEYAEVQYWIDGYRGHIMCGNGHEHDARPGGDR
jgi:hypothetical protein